jgi:hypothetical protein
MQKLAQAASSLTFLVPLSPSRNNCIFHFPDTACKNSNSTGKPRSALQERFSLASRDWTGHVLISNNGLEFQRSQGQGSKGAWYRKNHPFDQTGRTETLFHTSRIFSIPNPEP